MSGNAIKDVAGQYWYSRGSRDKRLSRRLSAEAYRYQQIEIAAQALVDYHGTDLGKIGELKKNLRRALKLSEEPSEL